MYLLVLTKRNDSDEWDEEETRLERDGKDEIYERDESEKEKDEEKIHTEKKKRREWRRSVDREKERKEKKRNIFQPLDLR